MNEQFANAVRRISEIDWAKVGNIERISNMALAKEYLRRGALLISTYSLNVRFPFFDAAQSLGKTPDIDIVEVCPQLEMLSNTFIRRTCECYLKWAILVDEGDPIAIEFCDLYEPLIKLFERGGTVGLHHGDVMAGGGAFPLPNIDYMAKQDPIDITDNGLDAWER